MLNTRQSAQAGCNIMKPGNEGPGKERASEDPVTWFGGKLARLAALGNVNKAILANIATQKGKC